MKFLLLCSFVSFTMAFTIEGSGISLFLGGSASGSSGDLLSGIESGLESAIKGGSSIFNGLNKIIVNGIDLVTGDIAKVRTAIEGSLADFFGRLTKDLNNLNALLSQRAAADIKMRNALFNSIVTKLANITGSTQNIIASLDSQARALLVRSDQTNVAQLLQELEAKKNEALLNLVQATNATINKLTEGGQALETGVKQTIGNTINSTISTLNATLAAKESEINQVLNSNQNLSDNATAAAINLANTLQSALGTDLNFLNASLANATAAEKVDLSQKINAINNSISSVISYLTGLKSRVSQGLQGLLQKCIDGYKSLLNSLPKVDLTINASLNASVGFNANQNASGNSGTNSVNATSNAGVAANSSATGNAKLT